MIEGVGSIAAIILTILGLARVLPTDLSAVAVIGIGISLLFEGGTVGARFSRLLASAGGRVTNVMDLGGGMTAEFMAGAAGVVLGLLALLGIAPTILPPVAAIVFGGALLLGSGAAARLSYMEITNGRSQEGIDEVAREAVAAAAGAQVLTGLAAGLLGILALVGFYPLVLTLVALLCTATAVLMSGTAISRRILSLVA
ncbi:MAG TPA: hypothetical protein VMA35_10845 [Candidatus Sulfopaludibacter sp.]|nr:hypothetical protein [Candidatus Sulfopaludibacter sp.]